MAPKSKEENNSKKSEKSLGGTSKFESNSKIDAV